MKTHLLMLLLAWALWAIAAIVVMFLNLSDRIKAWQVIIFGIATLILITITILYRVM